MSFIRKWMLPLAMTAGVAVYLLLRLGPPAGEEAYLRFAARLQPLLMSAMLFLQLNLVAIKDLRLERWHLGLLLLQALLSTAMTVLALVVPVPAARILLECAMLCFICPTAAAAGVITARLGGSLSGIMTYTVLANTLASVMIPLLVPLVHPMAQTAFLPLFWAIVKRVFSILLLPCVVAWAIRYTLPSLQAFFARLAPWAFYLWGACLMLSISLSTQALLESGIGVWLTVAIGAVSLVCCLLQFALGRRSARRHGPSEALTAGQALGQKNTGFIIWLGINYLTPVTSVAGGLYAIWHNLVNSWELAQKTKQDTGSHR